VSRVQTVSKCYCFLGSCLNIQSMWQVQHQTQLQIQLTIKEIHLLRWNIKVTNKFCLLSHSLKYSLFFSQIILQTLFYSILYKNWSITTITSITYYFSLQPLSFVKIGSNVCNYESMKAVVSELMYRITKNNREQSYYYEQLSTCFL